MKYFFSIVTTIVIVFITYLGMAYITKIPQSSIIEETTEVSKVVYNKAQPVVKSHSKSSKAALKSNLKEPNQLTKDLYSIKTYLTSSVDKAISRTDISSNFLPNTINNKILMNGINRLDLVGLKALYPYEAYRDKINGWVLLKLFISKVGKVVDVQVLDSSPRGLFEKVAIKAAYKKVFPINETEVDPKKFTRNILSKYNADPNFL